MSVETMPERLESPVDPARAEVEALLTDVPFREPIVDDYDPSIHDALPGEDHQQTRERIRDHAAANKAQNAEADYQWLTLSEAARRGISNSLEVRQAAAKLTSEPLSETLPERAVSEIAEVDERTARLARLMGKTLGKVLGLGPVPDELVVPDISNAPSLLRKDSAVDSLVSSKRNLDNRLESTKRRALEHPGITRAERDLIARRYRYARDVKLLGLMAELYDQPLEAVEAENGVVSHELESGTKLVMTAEAFEASPTLLDPQKWESRTQLKDRVYTVVVDGRQYIMKERKTPRHTDVKRHGHVDGLTSEQEFAVAREFAELGTIKHGDVELHWEKPLGYVEFPDGYQFCLFEAEPGLSTEGPQYTLVSEILASRDEYHEEYEQLAQQATEIYHGRKDLMRGYDHEEVAPVRRFALSRAARAQRKAQKAQPKPDELTFEEFAELKARYLIEEAEGLLSQTMWDEGYTNSDVDGYGFRVRTGTRPSLEIIGFDFEYYRKDPEDAARIRRNVARNNESGDGANTRSYHYDGTRRIMLAASYAMLERIGWKIPPQESTS